MNDLNVLKIAILRKIFEKKGRAGSYSLFKMMKIPMADFMKIIFELESSESIVFDGDWLEITKIGKEFLVQSRPKNDREINRGIPSQMLREFRLTPGEPYIPSISRLDSSLRKKLPYDNIENERAQR